MHNSTPDDRLELDGGCSRAGRRRAPNAERSSGLRGQTRSRAFSSRASNSSSRRCAPPIEVTSFHGPLGTTCTWPASVAARLPQRVALQVRQSLRVVRSLIDAVDEDHVGIQLRDALRAEPLERRAGVEALRRRALDAQLLQQCRVQPAGRVDRGVVSADPHGRDAQSVGSRSRRPAIRSSSSARSPSTPSRTPRTSPAEQHLSPSVHRLRQRVRGFVDLRHRGDLPQPGVLLEVGGTDDQIGPQGDLQRGGLVDHRHPLRPLGHLDLADGVGDGAGGCGGCARLGGRAAAAAGGQGDGTPAVRTVWGRRRYTRLLEMAVTGSVDQGGGGAHITSSHSAARAARSAAGVRGQVKQVPPPSGRR